MSSNFQQTWTLNFSNVVQHCYMLKVSWETLYRFNWKFNSSYMIEQGLASHQTHYRSYWGWVFYESNDPTNSVKALKEDRVLRTGLQSQQVHPTMLTIIQQLCSVKQKHTKYTQINTNKSMHSEMDTVWQFLWKYIEHWLMFDARWQG